MAETEEEERDAKFNANNVTMDTFFNQYPLTINTQRKDANVKNKRRISSNILAEIIKEFNGSTIKSTFNYSACYDSEEDGAESDPKNDSLVAIHTSDGNKRKITDNDTNTGNSAHKLLTNREISLIVQGVNSPVKHTTADGVTKIIGDLHAVRTVLHKEIVTDTTRSTAGVLKDPLVKTFKYASGPIPVDKNIVGIPPRTTTQVLNGTGPSAPPPNQHTEPEY